MPRRTTGGVAAALRTIQLVQSLRDSEQAVEVAVPVRHSTILELRVMASDRAKLIAPTSSLDWVMTRLLTMSPRNEGIAIPSNTASH